jgi:CHAT domain-containing protein/tetratricopeptide (TPR) repeat protein
MEMKTKTPKDKSSSQALRTDWAALQDRARFKAYAFLTLLFSLASCQGVWSQQGNLDSMQIAIEGLLKQSNELVYNDTKSSYALLTEADSLATKYFGKNTMIYLKVLYYNYVFYNINRDNKIASNFLDKMDSLRSDLNLDGTEIHATHLARRCEHLRSIGQYIEAMKYCEQSLSVYKDNGLEKTFNASNAMISLATLYRRSKNLREGKALLLAALEIREQNKGRQTEDCAFALYDLGLIYRELGELAQSESAFLECKSIREQVLGKMDVRYAWSLSGLAGIYKYLGNYTESEKYYMEALEIREAITGRDHADYISTLSNLGGLYLDQKRYAEATEIFRITLDLRSKLLGTRHPLYAASLNNYSAALYYGKNFGEAAKMFQEAIHLREELIGKDKDYGMYKGNLAECLLELGDLENAEKNFRASLHIFDSLGVQALVAQARGALGRFLAITDNGPEALKQFGLCMQYHYQQMRLATNFLSESEISKFQETSKNFKSGLFSTYWLAPQHPANEPGLLYDHILFEKDFILQSTQQLQTLARRNEAANALLQGLRDNENKLVVEKAKHPNRRAQAVIDSLEQAINLIEKNLRKTITSYESLTQPVYWNDVRSGLQKGEAAVEFFHFPFGTREVSDSVMYLAMVLKADEPKPLFIPLFEERALAEILSSRNEGAAALASLYASRGGILLDEEIRYGDALYHMIWAPLESALMGVETVICSPSGLLHRINLGAIPGQSRGRLMMDRFSIRQVSSTRDRPGDYGIQDMVSRQALLLGGLDYSISMENPSSESAQAQKALAGLPLAPLAQDVAGYRDGFDYLPASLHEVTGIALRLRNAGFSVESWTGTQGTEERLKASFMNGAKSTSILHLATHGYYLDPDASESGMQPNAFQYWHGLSAREPDPLMRSGLALAGANGAWLDREHQPLEEDGICTAREITQLDLSGVRLVVLSACETARGDLNGAEGVFGLQRAFRLAGADKMVVSLWKVPDAATADFMDRFYRECAKGQPVHQAFHKARSHMRKKRPFHEWGAWVLLE